MHGRTVHYLNSAVNPWLAVTQQQLTQFAASGIKRLHYTELSSKDLDAGVMLGARTHCFTSTWSSGAGALGLRPRAPIAPLDHVLVKQCVIAPCINQRPNPYLIAQYNATPIVLWTLIRLWIVLGTIQHVGLQQNARLKMLMSSAMNYLEGRDLWLISLMSTQKRNQVQVAGQWLLLNFLSDLLLPCRHLQQLLITLSFGMR